MTSINFLELIRFLENEKQLTKIALREARCDQSLENSLRKATGIPFPEIKLKTSLFFIARLSTTPVESKIILSKNKLQFYETIDSLSIVC